MQLWKLLPLPALTLIAACSTNSQSLVVSTPTPKATGAISFVPCSVLRPVRLSHADTDQTKAQVIALNSVIDTTCPQKDK